jgi:hypothetical protein
MRLIEQGKEGDKSHADEKLRIDLEASSSTEELASGAE